MLERNDPSGEDIDVRRTRERPGAETDAPKRAQPLWVSVADVLRRRIGAGQGSTGLSDVALAQEFKVSTAVVRQAVSQLVQEGLLIRQRGRGTFLAKEPLHGGLESLECFVDAWHLQGRSVRVELLDYRVIAAGMMIASGLDIQPGLPVVYLCRLRFADALPVAVDYRHIPSELMDGIPKEEFLQESIWRVLRRHKKVEPAETLTTIKAAAATKEEARHLDMDEGAPVLGHDVQVIDGRGRVIILGRSLYHPDRFVYTTRVKGRRL